MIINKGILKLVQNITADKRYKPNLAGILASKNKIVATDSFKLMEVIFNKEDIKNIEESIPTELEFTAINKDQEIMIDKEDILSLKIPKKQDLKIFENIFIGNNKNNKITLLTHDFKEKRTHKVEGEVLENHFPDYRGFFDNINKAEVGIGVDHMIEILQVYKDFGVKGVKLTIGNELEPLLIENSDLIKNIEKVKTILMPLKLN